MPLTINLRHLEDKDLHLTGELEVEDLDIDTHDELIQVNAPLKYDIQVQKMDINLLATGHLSLALDCQCARCLKPHVHLVEIPDWTSHIPLVGDEAVPVSNDMVDLTPILREDILIEFPQHPLCEAECSGLPNADSSKPGTHQPGASQPGSSAWSELNKLKF